VRRLSVTHADVARGLAAGLAGDRADRTPPAAGPDVIVDRTGEPWELSRAAVEFGAAWGGDEFWRTVAREVAPHAHGAQHAGAVHYLSVDEYRSDGSIELLALIEGRREPDGGVSLTLHLPHEEREASAAVPLLKAGQRGIRRGGIRVQLKELVHGLTDLIWTLERDRPQSAEGPILSYVQEAVAVEIEYRRRMRDLDRRLAEIEGVQGVSVTS